MTKQSNIIFVDGKEKFLQKIFNSENFGYAAFGFNSEDDTNGFENISNEVLSNGFHEIEEATYSRVPISFQSVINTDDNGLVTARFTAELGLDNVIDTTSINQIAIVDSIEKNAPTTFFAASTTHTYEKSEKLALIFIIDLTM